MSTTALGFGPLLKECREKRGLSQSRLAALSDFDHSYCSRLESGSRQPTRDAVERLAKALCLDGAVRDTLLSVAGFMPRDFTSLLSNEPVVGEVLDLLQDEAVPSEYRESMRQVLRLLARQGRMAIGPVGV